MSQSVSQWMNEWMFKMWSDTWHWLNEYSSSQWSVQSGLSVQLSALKQYLLHRSRKSFSSVIWLSALRAKWNNITCCWLAAQKIWSPSSRTTPHYYFLWAVLPPPIFPFQFQLSTIDSDSDYKSTINHGLQWFTDLTYLQLQWASG